MKKSLLLLLMAAFLLPAPMANARSNRDVVGSTVLRHRHRHLIPRPLPPPMLMVRRGKRSVPLQLTRVDIQASIVGHLAETRMTLTFYNPNNRSHEGDLYFPLPEGSTVSGYALDVHGRMVEGVVVEKNRARQVFETEVRKGIDPGLVEWTKGRNFKTRVFPIPARGSRTIRVSYVADVNQTAQGAIYRLPLSFRKKVKAFSLRVEVIKAASKPLVKSGGPRGLRFATWRDSFVASAKLKNVKLTRDLRVSLPNIERKPVHVQKGPDGKTYFTIRDVVKQSGAQITGSPRRVALYWDASMSRAKTSHAAELKLLSRYLNGLRNPVEISLVPFRNVAERPRRFRLPAQRKALMKALRTMRYDGGTQVGSVRRLRGRFDLVLFFSDGLSNFGVEKPPPLGAPVYTINASTSANHAFLRYLALRSGGAYLNLNRTDVKAAVASIGAETFSFISAHATGAAMKSLYPKVRVPVQGFFTLAGYLTAPVAKVTLNYGVGSRVTLRRTFTIRRKGARKGNLLRRAWAQKKLDDLMIFPARNRDDIASLGKAYALVTPATSLLVLEQLSQYIQHRIRPPASLPGMATKYDLAMRRRARLKRRKEASKLSHVLALWKKRTTWYNTRFKRTHRAHPAKNKTGRGGGRRGMGVAPLRSNRTRSPRRDRRTRSADETGALRSGAINRLPVSAEAMYKKAKPAPRRSASIALQAWNPKTPYITALRAAPRYRRYDVYLAQRVKHGAAPAFYLDCANFFRRKKQNRIALRILSNLAELELENPALIRVLAHRLAQIGELDLSVLMFRKILALRPEEPQSYRDLALVLARRADGNRRLIRQRHQVKSDYAKALELLAKVVMNKWQRFNEIEVIALTELNNILPKARRVGIKKPPVDRRLLKHLTLDIRIVMNWDADLTDMDLHVLEPSGEVAYYGHNRTQIGGMVSRDFTRGYGPEIYAVRRAMRGRYTIKAKFYGSSAAKLAGAVTLQVDVYTNYGRPNQRRRSLTLRLTKKKDMFVVGRIRF
jgi:Ca-activated chloride channel homolog